MAGKIKEVRIVTFSEDYGRYTKGEHAMHVSLAEKLKAKKAPISVKLADAKAQALKEKRQEEIQKSKEGK